MRAHEELEQLSALLDGELPGAERARVEGHVAACAECARVLDALRATASDLARLEAPEPAPQQSWALRAAVRRARSPRPWTRLVPAFGTAAAALVAVLAIVLSTGDGGTPQLALEAPREETAGGTVAADYTADSVGDRAVALAAGFATRSDFAAAPQEAEPAGAGRPAPATAQRSVRPALPAAMERCRRTIPGADRLELLGAEEARFEGRPAYLYGLRAPRRVEVWVMASRTCDVLFFAQAPIE